MARLIFSLLVLLLTACTNDPQPNTIIRFQGSTMGTLYHISIVTNNKQQIDTKSLKQQIDDKLEDINQQMSTYRPQSEITLFNKHGKTEWFPVSIQLANIVITSNEISQLTNGLFDITAGNLVNLWGFGPEYKLKVPEQEQINTTLQKTGYHLLDSRLKPPALIKSNPALKIDLSAIAKGYAVDQLGDLLIKQGFQDYLVEIGGEILSRGNNTFNKPWRIAIENPSTGKTIAKKVLLLTNQSVATSGDYRNYFEKSGKRYSHTINPLTGKPINHNLASVTLLGKSTMRMDALATALMVMGEIEGKNFAVNNNLSVFMIIRNKDGSFYTWDNLEIISTDKGGY